MKSKKLSKSDFILGLQCPLALWFEYYRKDLKRPISREQQAVLDVGREVGEYAKKYFGDGFEVDAPHREVEEAIRQTKQAVANGEKIIFEATAQAPDGTYSRIDILRKHPAGDGWDLIEVKSSTKVKPEHYDDIGFQYYVFHNAGYKIRDCYMMLINNEYVRNGEIDPKQLLKLELVTEKAIEKYSAVQDVSAHLMSVLQCETPPQQDIGAHCTTPFDCDYRHHCRKHVPEYSIFDLFSKNKRKAEKLYKVYGPDIANLPKVDWPTNDRLVDTLAFFNNEEHVDKVALRTFLEKLEYPLYFLDYETFRHAIPLMDGTRPYQQVPFQFSLHIQKVPGPELKHVEFLHRDKSDPRSAFVEALIKACGDQGSVIVYYQAFEEGRNKELQETYPQFADSISNITQRMVDLLVPFKKRAIYHPRQNGSASLKNVLPTFTDLSYDGMGIADGIAATRQYLNYQRGMLSDTEEERTFNNLSKYCELDTLGMVRLLEVLERKADDVL